MKIKFFGAILLCLTLLAIVSGCEPETPPRSAPATPPRSEPETPARSAPTTPVRYELMDDFKARVEDQADEIDSLLCDGDYAAVSDQTKETTHLTAAQVEKKVSSLYHDLESGFGRGLERDTYGLGESFIVVDTSYSEKGKNILTYTFDKNERFCGVEGRLEQYDFDIDAAYAKASDIFKRLCAGKFDEVVAMIKNPREYIAASELKAKWNEKGLPLGSHIDTNINLEYATDESIGISQFSQYENLAFDIRYEFSHQLELKDISVYVTRFEADARKIMSLLYKKKFNAAAKKIKDPNTSVNTKEKRLKTKWNEVVAPLGKFKKYNSCTMDSEFTVYCSVEFERGKLEFRIGFDSDENIIEIEFGNPYVKRLSGAGKPVIYLYPEHDQQVQVKLKLKGNLSYSYPEYHDGWDVLAKPDGTLLSQGREYSYLFWESDALDLKPDFSEGFVVSREDTISFLQKSLEKLGLTPREYNEFIVYWAPIMQKNAYNKVTFVQKEYTDAAALTITPQPDSILRVFMAFTPAEPDLKLKPQDLKSFTRHGFTVVEWGGFQFPR